MKPTIKMSCYFYPEGRYLSGSLPNRKAASGAVLCLAAGEETDYSRSSVTDLKTESHSGF